VGEVNQPQHPIDHGVAQGNQRIQAAPGQALNQIETKTLQPAHARPLPSPQDSNGIFPRRLDSPLNRNSLSPMLEDAIIHPHSPSEGAIIGKRPGNPEGTR